jgi:hypothetical protein
VFNKLGLLIHEIVMAVPIIGIEWVGDMSAPVALPNRVPSLSPEPRSAMKLLDEDSEELAREELGTVHISPHKRAANRYQISDAPDLFSGNNPRRTSIQPLRRPSDISNGSPVQTERPHEHPRRKSLIRPRIATETFKSPTTFSNRMHPTTTSPSLLPKFSNQESNDWSEEHCTPTIPLKSPARCLPSYQNSPSPSSKGSEIPEEQLSTPPSTKNNKSKAPARLTSPRVSLVATEHPSIDRATSSLSSPYIPSTPSSPPDAQIHAFVPYHSRQHRAMFVRRMPQRQLNIEAPDTPSSLGPESGDQRRLSATPGTPPRTLPGLDSSSGVHSRRTSRGVQNPARPGDGEMETRNHSAASQRDVYSDGEGRPRFKVARREHSATIGVSDEVQKLRNSNEMLRREMEALREDFRALRNVLIGSKRR